MFEILAVQGKWFRFVCVVESFTSHEDIRENILQWLNIVLEDVENIEIIFAYTEEWKDNKSFVSFAYTYEKESSKFGDDVRLLVRLNTYHKDTTLPD